MSEERLSVSESSSGGDTVDKNENNSETKDQISETNASVEERNSEGSNEELEHDTQKDTDGEHEEELKLASHQPKNQREIDRRSVNVGNIDYSATTADLKKVLDDCGEINRITILYNHYTGRSKGFAYVEFNDVEGAKAAIELNGTELYSRALTIQQKRTNIPGMGRRRQRRGGFRGGRGRGGFSEPYRGRRWRNDKQGEGEEEGNAISHEPESDVISHDEASSEPASKEGEADL